MTVNQARKSALLGGREEDIKTSFHPATFEFHQQRAIHRSNDQEALLEALILREGQRHHFSCLFRLSSGSQNEVPDPPSSLHRGRRVCSRH